MIRLSVVIPTLDRPGPLRACLEALADSFPSDGEVIVVSDGGRPLPAGTFDGVVEPLRLRHARVPHGGPAAARNHGLALARGQVVAFTDDDCRPGPGWLESLAGAVSLSPLVAAGGRTRNGFASNPYSDASELILYLVGKHSSAKASAERFLPSNNLAFPADALRRLGGFDPRFRTAEDRELCRRWQAAGFGLRFVEDAVLDHDSRLDLRGFIRQFVAYGRGAAQFHADGGARSLRASARFHLRLPVLAGPEILRRGPRRGARLLALLVVWELANLWGFLRGPWVRQPEGTRRGAPARERAR